MLRPVRIASVVLVLVSAPAVAFGQLCSGLRSEAGALVPLLAVSRGPDTSWNDVHQYHAETHWNVRGPLAFAAAYGVTYGSNVLTTHSVGGELAYELNVGSVSVCPTAGVERGLLGSARTHEFPGEPDVRITSSSWLVPAGVRVGAQHIISATTRLVFHGYPHVQWLHAESVRESDAIQVYRYSVTAGALRLGGGIEMGPIYLGWEGTWAAAGPEDGVQVVRVAWLGRR